MDIQDPKETGLSSIEKRNFQETSEQIENTGDLHTASEPKPHSRHDRDNKGKSLLDEKISGTSQYDSNQNEKAKELKDVASTRGHHKGSNPKNNRPLHAADFSKVFKQGTEKDEVTKNKYSTVDTPLDNSRQPKGNAQDVIEVSEPKHKSLEEYVRMPSWQSSSVQQHAQQECHVEANCVPVSRYTETNEKLNQFIEYFVKESEAKLHSYHLILEGELKKSGKFSDTFSGIIGQGLGTAVGVLGVFFGLPASGRGILASAGRAAGEKLGNKLGNYKHTNKVVSLSNLINCSQKDKYGFRKILVETGFDIFRSFEMQFMRVSTSKGPKDAIHLLAKDAVNRAINYLKSKGNALMGEGVILGESKKESVHSLSRGFQIKYEYQLSSKTWTTANLYHKVGLLAIQKSKPCFYKKKDSTSDTGKYGYRRLLTWENWDELKRQYKPDNIAESKSGQFADYDYILCLEDMEVKCKSVLEKINSDDKGLAEKRIKEILEEVKSDIMEEINALKKLSHGYTEDRKVIANMETNLKDLKMEEYFQIFKQHFEEAKDEREEMIKSINEAFEDASQQRQKIASDNKREHEITQGGVGKLKEGIEKIEKDQEESQIILIENKQVTERVEKYQFDIMQTAAETGTYVKQIKEDIQILTEKEQTKEINAIWFDMRESVESFTGRQEQLDQIASYIQHGTVAVVGLSGVGKSELAVRHARTEYSRESNVIWINAESRETTKQSFHRLYRRLGFRLKDEDGTEKDIKSIVEDLYDHLSDRTTLFVFDNAEKYSTIKDLLPLGLPSGVKKPYVLITCNNLEVVDIKTLPLGDFNIKESMDFINKFLDIQDESQISEIQHLAKKLHNFPLALQQAVAYITEEDKKIKNVIPEKCFTIQDYLEEYEKKTEDLLKSEVFQKLGSDYDKTVFTAFHITLSKIRDNEYSETVLEVLNLMAYFAPDNIPAKVFLDLVNGDERELGSIIQLLKGYSIIRHEGLLNMHGLVQQVLRLELEKREEGGKIMEERILNKALSLLKKYMVDYKTVEDYLSHIISVWNHANKYDALTETFIAGDIGNREVHTTYFHIIVEGCSYDVVERIVNRISENHPNELSKIINQESNSGVTPLHSAALSGDERTIRLLLDKGANVNVETKRKWSPLHFAAKHGYLECVNALLDSGASINVQSEYKFTPLHVAAKGGYIRIVDVLLDVGADVNSKTNRGFTPLHFAVDNGRIAIVVILLGKGAGVNGKTHHEYTPLHLAVKGGHEEICNVLLANGAEREPKTRLKFTPLHFAAQKGHLSIVKALLNEGVCVDAKDGNHFTPLHLAAFDGHTDVVNALLYRNANVDAKTTKGNTPLHLAAEKGHLSVVEALIAGKAKSDIKNQDRETVSDLAVKGRYTEIINEYIIQHCQNMEKMHVKQNINP